jgi:hypothetical protein
MKSLSMSSISALALVVLGAGWAAGCGGAGDVSDTSLSKPTDPKTTTVVTPPAPVADCIEPACQVFPLQMSAHAVRLTNPQWERTIQDLLKLDAQSGLSMGFPPDPVASPDKFGQEAGDLVVGTDYWAAYQQAAEALSTLVTSDPTALDKILPDAAKSGDQTPRVAAFVADFLPRAYRRDVTQQEIDQVIAAGEAAAQNVSTGDPFVTRVNWILNAVLQSPKFIYRISLGVADAKDGRARLTASEIATKLSFGLWGTMPDDALVAKAKAGSLDTPAGVAQVAADMLKDPRSAVSLLDFHDQLYLVNFFTMVQNRPLDLFPNFYDGFMNDAIQDMRLTVSQLVVKGNGGVKELTTSPVAFVNTALAPVYDIDPATVPALAGAAPDTFAQVALDPTKRKGLLMHAGWLAYEGSPGEPSPIHRGAFIARHVICTPLGQPPAGAAGAMPDADAALTNRLRVTDTTKGCGDGCHGGVGGVINPLGFAFEGFDSVGKQRLTDGLMRAPGQAPTDPPTGAPIPVDTTGQVDAVGKFSGATQLFDTVSTNARAHACYAAHWSSYLNGTSLVDVTPKFLSPAVAKSLKGGSVRDIIVELVQTDAFLTVSRSQ